MQYRRLGKTGYEISTIGFGAWAIGADWGNVDDEDSLAALHAAVDAGVNFIDTADVYGDGRSERVIAGFLRERAGERIYVATKMGRRVEQKLENYTPEAFRAWIQRSRDNLGVETPRPGAAALPAHRRLLHARAVRGLRRAGRAGRDAPLRRQRREGRGGAEGHRVPRRRHRPDHLQHGPPAPGGPLPDQALAGDVGVLARVPLASGLLTGKYDADSTFAENDHRNYNRQGEAFDVGETFAGLDYETGLEFVEPSGTLVPAGATTAQMALRWILMYEGVTAAIPGAKAPAQARANAAAADLPASPTRRCSGSRELYERYAKPLVHQRW